MTKAEAKAVMIEFWGYLAEHPECERKRDTPPDLFEKVKNCINWCPLCEIYGGCQDCILCKFGARCGGNGAPYEAWNKSPGGEAGNASRAAAAKSIVDIAKAWDTEAE
jgi:hypothetical protein